MTQMAKYNATVYPYHKDFSSFLLNEPLLTMTSDLHIQRLVSPSGRGYDQRSTGYAGHGFSLRYEVDNDLMAALEESNALLLLDADSMALPREETLHKAREAILGGNHLLCGMRLNMEEGEALSALCGQNHVDFIEFHKRFEQVPFSRLPRQDFERTERLPVPVIGVGDLLPKLNGTEAALALVSHFTQQGYNALPILSDNLSCLVCRYRMEDILYDDSINPVDKVIHLNRWMMEVCKRESPDMIIVQLPGDLMAINNRIQTTHGLYSFILSQAIGIDAFVLCLPYDFMNPMELAETQTLLRYRFSLSPDAVFLSNRTLNTNALIQQRRIEYLHIPVEAVLQYTRRHSGPLGLPLFSAGEMDKLCDYIEDTLVQYRMACATI